MKRVAPVLIVILLLGCRAAHSSESGMSNYLPGFQDALAGVQPPPGFYFQEKLYFYTGNAGAIVSEGRLEVGLHEYLPMQLSVFNQVTTGRLWGSNYAWALIVPFSEPKLTGQIVTPAGNVSRSQSVSGLADIEIVPIMLGWHNGRSHQKAWLVVYAPTGDYDLNRFVNTSLNRWAFELDYAYTFLDLRSGLQFDVAPGYTFSTKNTATDYQSGQEFHVDFAALQRLSPRLSIGAVGYAFVQTTADTGSGARLGPFRGQTYALGPVVNYDLNVGSVPVSFIGKYYGEFAVSNRFEGHSYWLNISASF